MAWCTQDWEARGMMTWDSWLVQQCTCILLLVEKCNIPCIQWKLSSSYNIILLHSYCVYISRCIMLELLTPDEQLLTSMAQNEVTSHTCIWIIFFYIQNWDERPGTNGWRGEDHDAKRRHIRHLHGHRDGHSLLRLHQTALFTFRDSNWSFMSLCHIYKGCVNKKLKWWKPVGTSSRTGPNVLIL